MDKLLSIQSELKAPKNQYNEYGNYKYRNAEDILEAVKPLLKKYGVTLFITDEVVVVSDRYYIKATVILRDADNEIKVCGFAREEEHKKGMDSMQLSGATSSYARKYALNGLFLIDDTKDADNYNKGENTNATDKQISLLKKLNYDKKVSFDEATQLISTLMEFQKLTKEFTDEDKLQLAKDYKFKKLTELNADKIKEINTFLQSKGA